MWIAGGKWDSKEIGVFIGGSFNCNLFVDPTRKACN
jgi:hypothetical protein